MIFYFYLRFLASINYSAWSSNMFLNYYFFTNSLLFKILDYFLVTDSFYWLYLFLGVGEGHERCYEYNLSKLSSSQLLIIFITSVFYPFSFKLVIFAKNLPLKTIFLLFLASTSSSGQNLGTT